MRAHCALTEDSLRTHDRKGREGNRKGGDVGTTPFNLTVGTIARPALPDAECDTDDLDLLDDSLRHARCTWCQPVVRALEPFMALCGRRAICMVDVPEDAIPPNACDDCVALYREPCRTCQA